MIWWLKYSLAGLSFLRIREDDKFWRTSKTFLFVFPAVVFSALVFGVWKEYIVIETVDIIATREKIISFLIFFVPFFLAALTIVSGAPNKILDEYLPGVNAYVKTKDGEIELTLRSYLIRLFGYLCFLGSVYIFGYLLLSFLEFPFLYNISVSSNTESWIYIYFLLHYLFSFLYSVYFLIEKISP